MSQIPRRPRDEEGGEGMNTEQLILASFVIFGIALMITVTFWKKGPHA